MTEGKAAAERQSETAFRSSSPPERAAGRDGHPHPEVRNMEGFRDLALVVAGRRKDLAELYESIADWPGLRIVASQGSERGTLGLGARRRSR